MAVNNIKRRIFTSRDFDTFNERLMSHLNSKFPGVITDAYESHFAMMAVELVSKLADDLMFSLDHHFNELFIDTVGERRNIRSLVKLVDYQLRNRTAAEVKLNCTCDPFAPLILTMRKGTLVSTEVDGIQFVVLKDYTITDSVEFEIEAREGYDRTDSHISDGKTGQEFTTSFDSVADNVPIVVKVDSVEWTKVDSLWEVETGNYYEQDNTDDLRARILFGDDVHGNIPPSGSTIEIEYFTCSGAGGNIPSGKINTSIEGELSGGGGNHTVNVNNTDSPASGGDDEEPVDEVRVNAPLSIKAVKGLVAASDYKGYSLDYPGVLAASVSIDNVLNLVTVYIVANGYQQPGPSLISGLKTTLQAERVVGLVLDVKAPEFIYVDVAGTVTAKDTFALADVENTVKEAVKQFFEPDDPTVTAKDFGKDIRFSDIVRLIDEQEGVDYVDITRLSKIPTISKITWHSTTADFQNVQLGNTAREEVWTIKALTYTTFQVIGSVVGLQQNIGTVNTPYITDEGELSFTLNQGVDPLEAGDIARIYTSSYVGNLRILEHQFALQGNVNLTFRYEPLGIRG